MEQCLRALNTLISKRSSERGDFKNSSNHIFRSKEIRKYLKYEADICFGNAQNFI